MSGAVDMPEGQDAIHRDLEKLEKWACVNKGKRKVLYMDLGNLWNQYRLENEGKESSVVKKDLGVLVDEKLDMTQQCALTAQKDKCSQLGFIKKSMASRSSEGILPLCSTLVRPLHGLLYPALEPSAQGRHGPVGVGPEEGHKSGQRSGTLSYREKRRELGLFSVEKTRLQEDLIAAFQY